MTDSCRCFDSLSGILVVLLLTVFPLLAQGQRSTWSLPLYKETVRVFSVAGGKSFARDTYLSASRYEGFMGGFEYDNWSGGRPEKIFEYGRIHADLSFGYLENRLGGGRTLELIGSAFFAKMWHAVDYEMCDLLVGPAAMLKLGALYNMNNGNNPANAEDYLAAGVCVDNTFRYRLFKYPMALQATLWIPLIGVGVEPDYDQTYWYMYRYNDYWKTVNFITPFNNTAFSQQISLILPVRGDRFKIGYSYDILTNSIGGHSRSISNNTFTIGYVKKLQTKEWGR